MKRSLVILLAVLVLAVIVGVVFVLVQHNQSTTSSNPTNSTNSFPISGNSPQGSSISSTSASNENGVYSVENTMGGTIITKDFLHNGVTAAAPDANGDYYLAGGPGYCPNGSCPSGASATDYYVVYRPAVKAFIIGLLKEPIGQSRQEAEQFLMNTLGISEAQMCDLNYYVLTTDDVNSAYAGENLGFSFCPGAVDLP